MVIKKRWRKKGVALMWERIAKRIAPVVVAVVYLVFVVARSQIVWEWSLRLRREKPAVRCAVESFWFFWAAAGGF